MDAQAEELVALGDALLLAFNAVAATYMGSDAEANAQALAWLQERLADEAATVAGE